MKIAVEAQRIFRPKKHGMDFVVLEVLRELQKIDTQNEYYIFVAPGEDKCLRESKNFHIIEFGSGFYPLWEQVQLPKQLKKIKPDILHCTSNTAPLRLAGVPLVVTIHDIIYLEKQSEANKSWYQKMGRIYRRLVVPHNAKSAKKIITVSNFERERIASVFTDKKDNIVAVYNGYGTHFREINNWREVVFKYSQSSSYLFFLGNTDPKKNVANTLVAYSQYLKKSQFKRKLLIADLGDEMFQRIIKENQIEEIDSYVELLGYVVNKDLPYIHNGAFAFLYTSKRESFGIPILEAMACGTPVVTGSVSAMPEVAGESCATLVDAFDANSIAQMILKLENDSDFYNMTVNYGLERVKMFSWENTARQTLEIFKSL